MLLRDDGRALEVKILRSVLEELYAAREILNPFLGDEQGPTPQIEELRIACAQLELAIDAAERAARSRQPDALHCSGQGCSRAAAVIIRGVPFCAAHASRRLSAPDAPPSPSAA